MTLPSLKSPPQYEWKNSRSFQLEGEFYIARCPSLGLGLLKKVDGIWVFSKSFHSKVMCVPLIFLENVFCFLSVIED